MKYLPGDILQEAEEAIRSGIPLGTVARRLGIEPDELRRALSIPSLKPIQPQDVDADLWASDRLDGLL